MRRPAGDSDRLAGGRVARGWVKLRSKDWVLFTQDAQHPREGAAESLRAFRLAESIRRSEVYACMYVRMSCDVMLFFEWFYVSKVI